MTTQIERLSQAERMLAEIATASDAVHVVRFAEAVRVWAQQARLGESAMNHATVIKMRAERRLADAVDEGQRKGEITQAKNTLTRGSPVVRTPDNGHNGTFKLEDLGVDRRRLAEARKIRDNYTDEDLIELQRHADEAGELLSRNELVTKPRTNAQRMQLSETNEWYTPAACIEAARLVLGGIDLDPASSAQANRTIQAARFYTKDDDGLRQPWKGRVWLNPPYGGSAGAFIARLAELADSGEVTAAIALVSSHSTDTAWFRPLWDSLLCFSYGRIQFTSSDGRGDAATHGSVFAYFGDNKQLFAGTFREFGAVVARWA